MKLILTLNGFPFPFEVTHYSPELAATGHAPAEPVEFEWHFSDPSHEALVEALNAEDEAEDLVYEFFIRTFEKDHE